MARRGLSWRRSEFSQGVGSVVGGERGHFHRGRGFGEKVERHAANELCAVGGGPRHGALVRDALGDDFFP